MKSAEAPAITRLAGRIPQHPTVVVGDDGIRYEGAEREQQLDPDFMVLWECWGGLAEGPPLYGEFDPEVQRRATDRLLCAYGMEAPHREPGEGMLWLLHTDADAHQWPADIQTTTPPICRPHAERALQRCATLRRHLAVRVREAEPIGVRGTVYGQDGPGGPDELVLFTDENRLRFVHARHLVLELRGAVPDPVFHPQPSATATQ
ncbi:hypothetical protein ACIQF5_21135 [Streptomyces goshikiensis]|uniref:hypothetical protein n=1 Tax=Streptomyces goshikiensis TaxID=1942 RepID=UPI003816F6D5